MLVYTAKIQRFGQVVVYRQLPTVIIVFVELQRGSTVYATACIAFDSVVGNGKGDSSVSEVSDVTDSSFSKVFGCESVMVLPVGCGGREIDKLREVFGSEFRCIAESVERVEIKVFLIVRVALPRRYYTFCHRLIGRLWCESFKGNRFLERLSRYIARNSYGECTRLFVAVRFVDSGNAERLPVDGLCTARGFYLLQRLMDCEIFVQIKILGKVFIVHLLCFHLFGLRGLFPVIFRFIFAARRHYSTQHNCQ